MYILILNNLQHKLDISNLKQDFGKIISIDINKEDYNDNDDYNNTIDNDIINIQLDLNSQKYNLF